MLKMNIVAIGVASLLLLGGCANEKLLLKTYNPPKKQEEVKKMLESSESSTGFISMEIVDDTGYMCETVKSKSCNTLADALVADVEQVINQTNFISITKTVGESDLGLYMRVNELKYNLNGDNLEVVVKVNFTVGKESGAYSQSYTYRQNRYSKHGPSRLPSESVMLSKASKYLAKKFIKDISPIKTSKLVELQELPKELTYTVTYAKSKNFKGAIKAMEAYKGEKEMEYYFNLGVYYEAYATQADELNFYKKAEENYDKAMAMGGSEDEAMLAGKIMFDSFYSIIKKVVEQRAVNSKNNASSEFVIE